jgi:hypothetical protein
LKIPAINLNIQVTEVKAIPRKLKYSWSMDAAMDLKYGVGFYDKWIEKIASPGYQFDESDIKMLEGLGYPGITVEEFQSGAIPPEVSESRISPEEDS